MIFIGYPMMRHRVPDINAIARAFHRTDSLHAGELERMGSLSFCWVRHGTCTFHRGAHTHSVGFVNIHTMGRDELGVAGNPPDAPSAEKEVKIKLKSG